MKQVSKKMMIATAALGTVIWSCGGSKGGDDDEAAGPNPNNGSNPTVSSVTNALAAVYPGGLALSIFPDAKSSTGLTLAADDDDKVLTIAAKAKESEKILKGEGDCVGRAFKVQLKPPLETCYEFDQEMIYGKRAGDLTYKGTLNGKNAKDEACLVAFARTRIKEVEVVIERALGVVQSMLCQAKKAGKVQGLPKTGESIDLALILKEAMGEKAARISKASITRLADENDRPVYRSDITLEGKNGETQETHLVHSPQSETDNNSYDGLLWTKISGMDKLFPGGSGMNQGGPKDPHMSVQYSKSSTDGKSRLKAQLLRARVADELSASVFKKGLLDLNVSNDSNNQFIRSDGTLFQHNAALSGMTFIGLNVDPDSGAGSVSYWENPGSNYSESARGMVFNLEVNAANGSLYGCGLTGARKGATQNPGDGISIRRALKETSLVSLVPNGFFHPFFNTESQQNAGCSGPDANGVFTCTSGSGTMEWRTPNMSSTLKADWVTDQMGSTVSRQCVVQNVETGLYVIDTAKISEPAGFVLIDGSAPGDGDKVTAPDVSGLKEFEVN